MGEEAINNIAERVFEKFSNLDAPEAKCSDNETSKINEVNSRPKYKYRGGNYQLNPNGNYRSRKNTASNVNSNYNSNQIRKSENVDRASVLTI